MHSGNRFLSYVQLLDSALPIGGFSHSFGLETCMQRGTINSLAELENWLNGVIHHNLAPLDGLAIKGMFEAMRSGDLQRLCHLDTILHVQRLPMESRTGLHKMGKRLLKLGKTLYPWMDFRRLENGLTQQHAYGGLPTIHAWIAFHLGISLDETVKGYLYSSIVTLVNSAIRLMALGQTDGQALIQRMLAVIDDEWDAVSSLSADDLHSFSLSHDIYAMNHETLYSRLFMS